MDFRRKRPPLTSSMSFQLTSGLDEKSFEKTVVRRTRFSRKESFQSSFSTPKEEEEFLLPESAGDAKLKSEKISRQKQLEQNNSKNNFQQTVSNGEVDVTAEETTKSFLVKALIEKDVEKLKERIEVSDDLEEEDEHGFRPMHYACKLGYLDGVKLLIKAGCDTSATNGDRVTSLHVAVRAGHDDVVGLLLEAGVVPDVRERKKGRTAIHEATLLAKTKILNVIVQNLQEDPWEARRILRISDKEGHTPLHIAAAGFMTETIGLLLAAGADVAATDNEGLTPMHLSLQSHRGKRRCGGVLTQLLEAGGDVEVEGGSDRERLSHFAARAGCSVCLEFLHARGADLEAQNRLGRTPLHVAAAEMKSEAVKFLVSAKVNLEYLDSKGQTPLNLAVLSDSPSVIEALLDGGANPSSTDTDGRSYVQVAILRRKLNAFQTLVKKKAVQLPEEAGEDLIHYCAALGFINSVTFLLENGWNVNLRDSKGRTALHRCLNHGHEDLAAMLINAGASLHEVDDAGATPLHYAVRWGGSDAILRLLVKKKAKLGVRDRLGRTPLHYAASKFSIMSDLYILLGGGSDLDSQDEMGLTPLHLAARLGNESLVRILLESGAKPNIRDIDDFLPVDHALEKGHKSIIKRLEAHQGTGAAKIPVEESSKSSRLEHRKSVAW